MTEAVLQECKAAVTLPDQWQGGAFDLYQPSTHYKGHRDAIVKQRATLNHLISEPMINIQKSLDTTFSIVVSRLII